MSDENQQTTKVFNVATALSDAQRIIREAERRAAELIRSAEDAAIKARDDGYAAGFEQGRQVAVETAVRMLSDMGRLRVHIAEEAASLSVAISSKIVSEHVKVDPSVVRKIAFAAIKQLPVARDISINCHPEDCAVLEQSLPDLQRLANGNVTIVKDAGISRGGCLVKSVFGEADATIESLLQKVAYFLGVNAEQIKLAE